ncbi:MAG: hypothetical protein ACI835_003408 [Planctomycetota bacterium]
MITGWILRAVLRESVWRDPVWRDPVWRDADCRITVGLLVDHGRTAEPFAGAHSKIGVSLWLLLFRGSPFALRTPRHSKPAIPIKTSGFAGGIPIQERSASASKQGSSPVLAPPRGNNCCPSRYSCGQDNRSMNISRSFTVTYAISHAVPNHSTASLDWVQAMCRLRHTDREVTGMTAKNVHQTGRKLHPERVASSHPARSIPHPLTLSISLSLSAFPHIWSAYQ